MATIRAEIINNSKTIRVTDLTDYTSYPNARGILVIRDPNGNYIVNNGNFDAPDITVGSPTSAEFALNLVGGAIIEGTYIIDYDVDYDLDDVSDDTTQLTFEYDTADLVTISIEITSSLADETIQSTDITTYGAGVTLDSRTHTLTYPASRGSSSSSDKATNTTIALTELFTGEYDTEITSGITIVVSSTYWIIDSITDTQDHTVWGSDGITDLESGIAELYTRFLASLGTDNGSATAALETTVTKVNAAWSLYKINRDAGDRDGAATYLNEIADILSAEDITIMEPTDESVPVAREYPGYATAWVYGSGVPADTLARDGDFYFRTDTNGVYNKASGTWTLIGTLGANTIIQFSADGSTGWTTTYANGLNYIRFSGDGGASWTVVSKFIDGYVYYAYTSDGVSADFIATDDPGFTFNPVLEYIALKKFDESHNGDLIAGDFTGLFTKYRDSGIITYSDTPSVSIPTDANGNNAVYPTSDARPTIYVYDGDTDVTSNWTIDVDENINITAVIQESNKVLLSAITSDTATVAILCTRSGYDDLNVRLWIHKTKAGQAVVDSTSVDDSTIEFDVPTQKIRVKDSGITGVKLNSNVVDDSTIELAASALQLKDRGITADKLDLAELNRSFTELSNSTGIANADGSAQVASNIAWIDTNRVGYIYSDSGVEYLACIDYSNDTWSVIGTPLAGIGGLGIFKICNLGKNRVVTLENPASGFYTIATYVFNGSIWTKTSGLSFQPSSVNLQPQSITNLDHENIGVVFRDTRVTDVYTIRKYYWNGSVFSQVGNELVTTISSSIGGTYIYSDLEAINADLMYFYSFDSTEYKLKTYSFDGTDWTQESDGSLDLSEGVRLLSLSDGELLIGRKSTNKIYNYKFVDNDAYLLDHTYDITIISKLSMTKLLDNTVMITTGIASTDTYIHVLFRLKINE